MASAPPQKHQAQEGQQPSKEEKVHNRGCMTELTQTTVLLSATVREGQVEGQDSVGGPRHITRQEHPLTSGEENRRTKLETATRQQAIRAPNQPYVDLTKDTDSETP